MSQAQIIPTASTSPIFNFKNCEIRTIMQDGQPWFVARDVCSALSLAWTGKTLSQIPDSWQRMCNLHIRRGTYEMRIISEPAVYKLAFRSNKPEADEFTNWVASDVLPSIRKTGKYEVAEKPKRTRKALPPSQPATPTYVDRLQLTPWDKVQLGKEAVAIFERGGKVGPRTLECVLLKLRYLDAIQDVRNMGNSLADDINKMRVGVFGKIVQAGNLSGCMTDPVMDIFCDDTYHLRKLAGDFELTAFRALNASICGAKMQGV